MFHPYKMVLFSRSFSIIFLESLVFLCRRNLPVDLVAHNAVISAAVSSSNLRDIQLLGRSWGGGSSWGRCEAKGHDAQRARHGVMVPSCSAAGGMPKAIDMPSVRNQTRIARTLTPDTRRPFRRHETAHGICFYAFSASSIRFSFSL